MNAYPRYFTVLMWICFSVLLLSGLLLAPGVFEMRLEWDVPVTLPGGMRSVTAALHGLGAMLLFLLVGALLPMHVRAGLRTARNVATGTILLTTLATLALTGWAIYYVSIEELSTFASMLHLGAGLVAAVPVAIHVIKGRRLRREREQSAGQNVIRAHDERKVRHIA